MENEKKERISAKQKAIVFSTQKLDEWVDIKTLEEFVKKVSQTKGLDEKTCLNVLINKYLKDEVQVQKKIIKQEVWE